MSRQPVLWAACAAAVLVSRAGAGMAHEGPPFPLFVDAREGPFSVSLWTDPDIGTGYFFVVIEPADGGELRAIDAVRVAVRPVSERLPEIAYSAESQPVRYGARYYAEVPFDRGEWWNVRATIEASGESFEWMAAVEATPDGTIGPIGLLVYAMPFVAVALLWLKAVWRRSSGVAG